MVECQDMGDKEGKNNTIRGHELTIVSVTYFQNFLAMKVGGVLGPT